MNNWLDNLPLKRKLTLVILLACSTALLLACSALAAYQLFDSRQITLRNATVLADVIAKNTQAALAFQDENSARQTLMALQAEPGVSAAALYTTSGSLFATYTGTGSNINFPARPAADGYRFAQGHLTLLRPVLLNNKRIGTIFLQTDLHSMYGRLKLFIAIAALALLASVLFASAISPRLQRPISDPILALAETARRIAQNKDYTTRLPAQGGHETGRMTESFNHLLASIEERDHALRSGNESLQNEVVERKGVERKLKDQLSRLALLQQLTRATSERQDLPSIFQVVIRSLEDNLPIDFGCIGLYDGAANVLTVTKIGVRAEELATLLALTEQGRIIVDENGLGRCCIQGHLIYESDVRKSPYPLTQQLAAAGLYAMVAAPLLVESKVFGVLIVARQQSESFSSGECEFLKQLSEQVGLAAHQAQLNEALQQAYNDLRQTQQAVMQQERLKALGQMASGIAHDINNAISPVALYTESLLEKEPNLSPRARDYLTTIQHAIEDVTHTVSRMREFYRKREHQLQLTPVKLNPLIQQVIDLSRARWSDMPQQRGVVIKLTTELEHELPPIQGVESEIREALVNLIFNAVDAMPEGGTLTLRTKLSEDRRSVLVEVTDTGIGMDEDTRRRCLEPFFTTKGERGTGLGLAMVYGTARRHNAEIEIESAPVKGTTMRLGFPQPPTQNAGPVKVSAPFAVPARLRLLVVDDDPLLIKSLRDTLESDGHFVVTANTGADGIATFRDACQRGEPFSLVITDLGMPYTDGRQVAAAVKAASANTPVILLTGWGQRLVAEGDIPPHVDRVLNKPPKLRELREAFAECLPVK